MLADTWPMRRPRRASGLPHSLRPLRPLLLGLWPLAAAIVLTAIGVALEVLARRTGAAGIAAAPRLFAERFLDLPLTPHSTPVEIGGGPILIFMTVVGVAAVVGRRLTLETSGRLPLGRVLVVASPFLLASMAIAASDASDAPPGVYGAILRALVPALWVLAGVFAGAVWQWAVAGRRRLGVGAARGIAAGTVAATIAVAALSAVALVGAIGQIAQLLLATRTGGGLTAKAWTTAIGLLMDWPNAGASFVAASPQETVPAVAMGLVLVAAGITTAVFLLPLPAVEIGAFVLTFATMLALAGLSSAPRHPGEAVLFAPQHLALLLIPAAVAGLAGTWVGGSRAARRLSALPPLRAFGDSLPPPAASGIGQTRPRLASGWRPTAALAAAALAGEAILLLAASAFPAGRPVPPVATTSPLQLVAQRYLAARARGDAAAAWAEMVVDEPAGEADAVRLDDGPALAAMLANPGARGDQPLNLRLVGRRDAGRDVAAEFSAGSHGERHPALLLRRTGDEWKVVVRAGTAEVSLAQAAALRFDGIALPARPSYRLIALPGPHTVAAGDGRVQRAESASLQVASGTAVRLQLAPTFTPEAIAAAAGVAKSLLAACAGSNAAAPPGCLQSATVPAPVTWRLVGDPAATIALGWDGEQTYTATGRYQYIAASRVHVPEAVAHTAATGAYRLALQWTGSGFTARGGLANAAGQPAPRPAVDEPALRRAVTTSLQECAASTLLRPSDCPNGLPSTRFVTPVSWRLLSDPGAQGAVEFDPATAAFSISGTFRMSASYTEGGQRKNGVSAGGYRATLLWDGAAPVVVNIRST